jgi:His/Glu/Gln/Arg/opine family amino acid ABC transporter permease subunit
LTLMFSNVINVDWGEYAPDILKAIFKMAQYVVISFAGGVALGLGIAQMRFSRFRIARGFSRGYMEIFRNLPLLSALFIVYFGLPQIGLTLNSFEAGVVSLILYYSAYLSEIFRGGLVGVPDTQREAAASIGLTHLETLRYVVWPQATLLALPGTTTVFVDLIKGTALLSTIAGGELMYEATIITANTFRPLEVYVVFGLIYVGLSYPVSVALSQFEKVLANGTPVTPRRYRLRREAERIARGALAGG